MNTTAETKSTLGYFAVILLLILPVFLFISSHQTIQKRSFNWYGGDYDPNYAYLLNSLNNACLVKAGHIDHPGTPAQVAGALILRIHHFITGKNNQDIQSPVYQDPEKYLFLFTYIFLAFNCLLVFFLGLVLLRSGISIWIILLLQLSPFFSGIVLYNGFVRYSQEVFLFSASMVFSALALLELQLPNEKKKWLPWMWALVMGFGIASKLTFIPLALLPLLLQKNFPDKLKFISGSIFSFVLFTLPISSRYKDLYFWIKALLTHTGQFGSGSEGFAGTGYFNQLYETLLINPLFSLLLVLTLIFLLFNLISRRKNAWFRLSGILLLVSLCGLLITAKHPGERYLLPYFTLIGILLISLIYSAIQKSGKFPGFIVQVFTLLVIVLVPWYGINQKQKLFTDIRNNDFWISSQVFEKLSANSLRLYGEPSSSPVTALFFGNVFSGAKHTTGLSGLYPGRLFVNPSDMTLKNWNGGPEDLFGILKQNNKPVFILNLKTWAPFSNESLNLLHKNGFQLLEVYTGEYQSIFLLIKTSGNHH